VTGQLLNVRQVAELVQLDETTVRRAIRRGELAASKPAGQLRVHPDDVTAWLERTRVQPVEQSPAPRPGPPSAPTPLRPRATRSVRDRLRQERRSA
jgi:excisionase family DNA binding protein